MAYILGIWGEAELILRIWGAKENIFKEFRNFLSEIWGDQCIKFRDQGSTDPLGASLFQLVNFRLHSACSLRRYNICFD